MIVTFQTQDQAQNENWSPRRLASLIAKRQSSGEDAKYLIAPLPIDIKSDEGSDQSHTATHNHSKKKPPKNFFKANRQALKEKQRINKNSAKEKEQQEKSKQHKLALKKQQRFGGIKSRLNEHTSSTAAIHDEIDSIQSFPLHLDDSTTGSQEFHIAFGRKVPSSSSSSARPSPNKQNSDDSKAFRHSSYGKTPAYITNRRAKIEREEQERQYREQNAPPAPGLVLMDESERLETMQILEENERIERDKLANIPFAMNAARAARLREAIEFRLKEIEDAKEIFSKDRVFVAQE